MEWFHKESQPEFVNAQDFWAIDKEEIHSQGAICQCGETIDVEIVRTLAEGMLPLRCPSCQVKHRVNNPPLTEARLNNRIRKTRLEDI